MSLQVWLPLNGNLNNNGVGNPTITNNGAVVNSSGKLGKCYQFANSIYITNLSNLTTADLTICFWCKTTSTASWQLIVGIDNSSLSQIHGIYVADSGRLKFEYNPSINIYTNPTTWHHVAFVIKSGKSIGYLDGSKISESTESVTTSVIGRLRLGMNTAIYMNDFRVYNECLSTKEIKEISKGLCLHYKLDGNYFGNPNILTNSMSEVTGTYSSGSYIDFKSWGGITVSANEVYTLSFDAKSTVDGQSLTTYFYNNSSGIVQVASSKTNQGKTSTSADGYNTYTLSTNYKRYWCTFTFNSTSTSASKTVLFRLFSGNATIKNVKLEKGGCDTPWVPNSSDSVYTTLGYNKSASTEYDCSGFGNNGTRTSVNVSNNSLRNTYCDMLSSSSSISFISPVQNGATLTEMTTSIWFNTTTLNSTAPNLICMGDNDFWRFRLASATAIWFYIRVGSTQCGATFSCKTLTDGKWHNCAVTFKSGYVYVYIDGDLIGSADFSSTATYVTCAYTNSYIGAYGSTYERFIGKVSDARIYMTALSANDIKELYNAPISITKSGSLMCSELVEIE